LESRTAQTVDAYGNVTERREYSYNQLSTPARTYAYTCLNNSNYTSRHIWNRMSTATVSNGGTPLLLATYLYDTRELVNRTDLRQHDTANYGPGFYHRGNVTTSMNLSGTVCTNYDIAGAAVTAAFGPPPGEPAAPSKNGESLSKRWGPPH
jgi:hypothetical protein